MFVKLHNRNGDLVWINMSIIKCMTWNENKNVSQLLVFNDPNGFHFEVRETPETIVELMKKMR